MIRRPSSLPPPSLSSRRPYYHLSPSSPSFLMFFTTSFTSLSDLLRHFRHTHLLKFLFRSLLLLFLPSLYLIFSSSSTPPRSSSSVLNLLSLLSFSLAFLLSLTIALPRFPSIRFLLSRPFSPPPPPSQPILWSIGSNPKSEKRLNSGSWVKIYSDGDVYEGEFHKGKCSGSGVYYYQRSGRYVGDWIDGMHDGYGVETWAKGSRYRGRYRKGLRHGIGVYIFFSGDVYAGEWSNGQFHGFGVHTCEDGSKYVGEFKWGLKHGPGLYHFRNGDTYAGEYFADKIHGFGVYRFGNGHKFEGAWHEGRRQGLGTYTFRNGEVQSGHWQNGLLDIPIPHINNNTHQPQPPYSLSHNKVLNVVQEARRAAEKAYETGRIDDGRVNKVVSSANGAANAARVAAIKAVQNRLHWNNKDV